MQTTIQPPRPLRRFQIVPAAVPQILLVDSDPSLASYIQSLLDTDRYEVQYVSSILPAWRQIADNLPDLIVLNADSVLGAFAWLACLKADWATAAIPVIIIAAQHHMPNLLCAIDLAADDYLPIEDLPLYLDGSIAQLLAGPCAPVLRAAQGRLMAA